MIASNITVFEYIKDTICSGWGISEIEKEFETDTIRLIKTSFLSSVENMDVAKNSDENDEYPVEKLQLEFVNNHKSYTLIINIYHGSGTPGCCASYYIRYKLVSDSDIDSESDSD